MKLGLFIFILFSMSLSSAQLPGSKTKPYVKADSKKTQFGAPFDVKQKTITVDEAIEQFKLKPTDAGLMVLEAKIDKVCQKKGCWMTIKSKTRDMRVIFKDYGFFVPTDISGKTVICEGTVKEEKLTLEETKHFVKDEGGDPSKVTEPMTDYQFVATGVVVKK